MYKVANTRRYEKDLKRIASNPILIRRRTFVI